MTELQPSILINFVSQLYAFLWISILAQPTVRSSQLSSSSTIVIISHHGESQVAFLPLNPPSPTTIHPLHQLSWNLWRSTTKMALPLFRDDRILRMDHVHRARSLSLCITTEITNSFSLLLLYSASSIAVPPDERARPGDGVNLSSGRLPFSCYLAVVLEGRVRIQSSSRLVFFCGGRVEVFDHLFGCWSSFSRFTSLCARAGLGPAGAKSRSFFLV